MWGEDSSLSSIVNRFSVSRNSARHPLCLVFVLLILCWPPNGTHQLVLFGRPWLTVDPKATKRVRLSVSPFTHQILQSNWPSLRKLQEQEAFSANGCGALRLKGGGAPRTCTSRGFVLCESGQGAREMYLCQQQEILDLGRPQGCSKLEVTSQKKVTARQRSEVPPHLCTRSLLFELSRDLLWHTRTHGTPSLRLSQLNLNCT